MNFSGNVVTDECFAYQNWLTETMIAEIEKVVLKIIESVYQDVSYNDTLLYFFFRSKIPVRRTEHNIRQNSKKITSTKTLNATSIEET